MRIFRNSKSLMTDEELMLLVRRGDQEALAFLYDRYSALIVKFFYRMLNRDMQKAQDFMHDLFVKIIEHPTAFDCNRRFDTWVFSLAYNQCKNEYRKQTVRDEYAKAVQSGEKDPAVEIETTHDVIAFENSFNSMLDSMDEKYRTVFILRYQQELSVKEIADIAGCPVGTVKSRLFNATRALSRSLKIFDPRKN